MPLNIGNTGSGGGFAPTLKFNAKDAIWTFRHDGGDEIIDPPKALFDFKNIQTGFMLFKPGEAPVRTFDPSIGVRCQKVHAEQKRGFFLHVYSTTFPQAGLAEFCSTSVILANVISGLYSEYEEGLADNAGKLPIVQAGANEVVKGKYGTNYAPSLVITGWADRPADLPDELPKPDEIGAPVGNGSNGHVPPPAAIAASTAEF